jgi:RNA polymerase sigma-70 factor, ECF subfamily
MNASVENFETTAMPFMNDLFRSAYRILGDREEAEDIVQETYMQAWKSFHRFEAGTNCKAWMFKILFHVIAHHRRRWFNWKWLKESTETLESTLPYEAPVSQDVNDEDVLKALEKIPTHYREVVLLCDVQEFSYKEIAEILAVPIGTVMSRINRGRKLLADELADFAAGFGIQPKAPSAKVSKRAIA